jgi:L-asparaginase/Glu-tRNA(Gln) amidotransferase subunit D
LKNDAVDNFLGALLIAGNYQIPEVCIYFGNKLLRGNRTTKISTSKLAAFDSPNYAPLAELGVNFQIYWSRVIRFNFEGKIKIFTEMSEDISMINIIPCLNIRVIESILQSSKAVVIYAYGMGNIPTNNKQLMNLLQ